MVVIMQPTRTLESTAPRIPRDLWADHPNWPEHVLLLGSHDNFRRFSLSLIQGLRDGRKPEQLEWRYKAWIRAMRSHEAYEERKLYPYLERRFGVSFEPAREGHGEMHEADEVIRTAFNALRAGATEDTPLLERALEAHHSILIAHLQLEEDMVIPLLLEMDRDEFTVFLNSSIRRLLEKLEDK